MKTFNKYFLGIAILIAALGTVWGVSAQAKTVFLPLVASLNSVEGKTSVLINGKQVAFSLSENDQQPGPITFSPATGNPGDTITLHGAHFNGVVLVLFGSMSASFNVVSDTELTAIVPFGTSNGPISVVALAQSAEAFTIGSAITPTLTPGVTAPPTVVPSATVGATLVPSATVTVVPVATATGAPRTPVATVIPPAARAGIWISQAEIDALPATGAGWTELLAAADTNPGSPSLSNQDSDNNVFVMAEALVCAKTKVQSYCDRVMTALKAVTSQNLENGSRALALGRELAAYVISADIINLKQRDPATDGLFRTKIKGLLSYKTTEAGSLIDCDGNRPNNWGGHCGASRIAVDLYLGDKVDLDKATLVLRGWLGDRGAYAGFTYGVLDWQSDPAHPVGVNPVGAMITGHSVDGGQPEELRRAGAVHFPPTFTDYGWEGLQGRVASAHMLSRAGYDVWNWSDRGILRAVQFLYDISWPAVGDDKWQIWVVNKAYGSRFPTTGGGKGKNVGWTQWTQQ